MNPNIDSILIVGINFFPEPTGIGKYTSEMAFHLSQKNIKVKVVTGFPYYPTWKVFPGYKNILYKTEIIQGVSVTRCPLYIPGSLSGLKRMLQDFSFFFSSILYVLSLVVRGKRYSVVFVPSPSFMSGFVGSFYTFFYRNTKFVYHIQDLQVDAAEELGMIKNSALIHFLKKMEGFILKRAQYVTTISSGMQKKISAKPYRIKKQLIFPNWVDFSNIYFKKPDLDKLSALGLPLNKKLIFYSGAVGEKQGLEIILNVAEKAEKGLSDLAFVISGSGPYAKILKQQANNLGLKNLYFIDLQPIGIFIELLNYAHIHLIIQKGKASDLLLPSKLTNILAVGGICIVTATPNTTLFEIVDGNKLGFVIPPEDPTELWKVLKLAMFDQTLTNTYKSNALRYAENNLKKEIVIDNFLADIGG